MIVGKLIREAEQFLDVIFEREGDDTPRLVYADWLEEHGEEGHARLIRVQCELAKTPSGTERAMELWIEAGRAWRIIRDQWWYELADLNLDVRHFHRGFLGHLQLWAGDLDGNVRFAWPRLPFPELSILFDHDGTANITDLLSNPCLRHTYSLTLGPSLNPIRAIPEEQIGAVYPCLARLRRLGLNGSYCDDTFLRFLVGSPLRRLVISAHLADSLSPEIRALLHQRFGRSLVVSRPT